MFLRLGKIVRRDKSEEPLTYKGTVEKDQGGRRLAGRRSSHMTLFYVWFLAFSHHFTIFVYGKGRNLSNGCYNNSWKKVEIGGCWFKVRDITSI